jgi:Fe-S-cluster containining protein
MRRIPPKHPSRQPAFLIEFPAQPWAGIFSSMNLVESRASPPPGDPLGFIAKPTPLLRASVERQRAAFPPGDFAEIMAAIGSIFDKYTAKLREFPPGFERGRALLQLMDGALQSGAHIRATCRKGCAGCCHYEIEITRDEAAVLAAQIRNGVTIDYLRLENQAARERKSPEWGRFWQPENRCVFLDEDGACRVYSCRPAVCRKHLVTSPAEACTTPGQPVALIEMVLGEILLSAALSLDGTAYASLPKMLKAALQPA